MTSRTILHAADIHLDSPLQKLERYENAPVERIRSATRRALERMVDLAIEKQVELVVIAGDLYDGDWNDQNTGLAFVHQAGRLVQAGIPLLVIRGNHDAANVMTRSLPLPKNPNGTEIFLASETAESRLFDDLGIAVHGQSFASRAVTHDLAADYPQAISGFFNLGLLHTGLEGNTEHANYAPTTPAFLSDFGYDYWALGHIHQREDLGIEGGPPIVFSGNIQGRHIREAGPKGCVLVSIDNNNRCESVDFQPLDVLRWQTCEIDISDFAHVEEIHDAYTAWITDALADCGDRLLIPRVRLVGNSPLHGKLHRNHSVLRSELQAIGLSQFVDRLWLEDVKVHTTDRRPTVSDSNLDGPMKSLTHIIDSLKSDSELGLIVGEQLKGIARRLPKELSDDSTESAIPVDDQEWLDQLVESSAADVLSRLGRDSTQSSEEAT